MPTTTAARRITQSAGIVMASILLSRALGFFREWTVAHQVGSNATTDTYYAAFTLPDFLNYLVAAGSLSLIFIPVFTKYVAEGREDEAWHIFSTVISSMGLVLVLLVALAEIFAFNLVSVIAPGFGPVEKARVAHLTRLMLPAQICFYMGGVLSAVQYAKGKFLVPSLAPVFYNVGIIMGGLLLSSRIGISGFAVGVVAGAFGGNFLLQVWGARRVKAQFHPNLDLRHPGFKLFLKLAIPIMLALSLNFTDDWIIRWFGSYLQAASITWLSYAKVLMRVPLGIVGQAVGVASFPILAQLYAERKFEEMNRTLNSTLKGIILMMIPISILTIAESRPIIYLVFSHTRLRGPDFEATAATLQLFCLGLLGWGLAGIIARGFYATRDTLTPAIVGTAMTALNLPVYWLLVHRAQHLGLALASSIGIIVYTLVLWALLDRRTHNREIGDLIVFFLKITAASALAGLACHRATQWLETRVAWKTTHGAFLVVFLMSSVGALLTVALAKLLRVRELDSYLRKLRGGGQRAAVEHAGP